MTSDGSIIFVSTVAGMISALSCPFLLRSRSCLSFSEPDEADGLEDIQNGGTSRAKLNYTTHVLCFTNHQHWRFSSELCPDSNRQPLSGYAESSPRMARPHEPSHHAIIDASARQFPIASDLDRYGVHVSRLVYESAGLPYRVQT